MTKPTEAEQKALEKEQRTADAEIDPTESPDGGGGDDTPRNQAGMPEHRNATREEIMSKAKNARKARHKADTDQLDEEGKRLQAAMEAEVRGEEHEFDAGPPADEADPGEEETPPDEKVVGTDTQIDAESVDSSDDMVTIKVDGAERQVPKSEVEAAGVAALQKEATGDERMKEATIYERSLRKLEAKIREDAERIVQQQAAAGGDGDGPSNLPTGAVEADIKEKTESVAAAIYSGDRDKVKDALEDLVTSVAQGRSESTPPPVNAEQFVSEALASVRAELEAEQEQEERQARVAVAVRVNDTFKDEFSDLYKDDRGFALTKAEFDRIRTEEPTADPVSLMRTAATTVTKLLNPPVEDVLAQREAAKVAAAAETPSSTQRAPTDKPKPRKTRKDVVNDMRRQRGQPTG